MALSLVRSPLMSLAIYLAGIPVRAGLDSGGRGFGYNLRVPIDPAQREHESEVYLKVVSAIAGREVQAYATLPVTAAALAAVRARLAAENIAAPFIVAHPGGGSNPGAQLASKRFPPDQLAEVLNRVAHAAHASVILLGGADDADLVDAVAGRLKVAAHSWAAALELSRDRRPGGRSAALHRQRHRLDAPRSSQRRAYGDADGTDRSAADTRPIRPIIWRSGSRLIFRPAARLTLVAGTGTGRRDGFTVDEAVAKILAFLDPARQGRHCQYLTLTKALCYHWTVLLFEHVRTKPYELRIHPC